mmetsp:Transcript_19828/g.49711  ORF Transcript_19828/g.49711 Transcript_19828/m.49711 type:complete len:102 (-) Transcript_19828:217-522(-)
MPLPYDGIDHERKAVCIQEATYAGAKGAALGLGVAAPIVAAGHYYSPFFRRFSVSAKTALVVSPLFLLFFLKSELTMNACAQRRRQFATATAAASAAEAQK